MKPSTANAIYCLDQGNDNYIGFYIIDGEPLSKDIDHIDVGDLGQDERLRLLTDKQTEITKLGYECGSIETRKYADWMTQVLDSEWIDPDAVVDIDDQE